MKFALRQLLKNPGFTAVAVLTLAIGIGANTAIFSMVNLLILNPVPGPEPDRLIQIGENSHGNLDEPMFGGLAAASIQALKTRGEFFADVVWTDGLHLERKTEDFIEMIYGAVVSPNFFAQWNIQPILGRLFVQGEAARLLNRKSLDRDTVMVVSYSFWKSRYGGSADILGKTIEANGRTFTIIGVTPPHFQFPAGAHSTFWIPIENPNPQEEHSNIQTFARLKPGVTVEQTQAMLDTVAQQLLREFPDIYDTEWRRRGGTFKFLIRPLREDFAQGRYGAVNFQRTLFGLVAAIGFVLLIACVNVANLMLARTEKRQQELAIRAALGAGRMRLMFQLFSESLLLATLGAMAGLAITASGMKVLESLIPENIPRLREIQIDGPTLAFTLLVSVGTTLLIGLVPAFQASRTSVGDALKRAGAGAKMSSSWKRYQSTLVVVEVALSLVLLTGAGLMVESVIRLLGSHPGFDPENLLVVHPGLLRGEKYAASDRASGARRILFEELREKFAALPGVKSVGIAKLSGTRLGFTIEGREEPVALLRAGSGVGDADFFRAMGIPLLAGRYFDKTDIGPKIPTVIINESMARFCWPGENALNKKFRDQSGRGYEVIGVISDARIGLRGKSVDPVEPTFYRPYHEQVDTGGFGPYFLVRTHQDPRDLIPAIRDRMKMIESSMTTPWFQVARQTLYDSTLAQRTYMLYLVGFSSAGLLLSVLGIYGVISYSVTRRTREIGIRIAVGAGSVDVIAMVMKEGARLIALGLGLRLLASFWLTRLLRNQLFEVSPTDPGVFLIVVIVLLTVALLACLVPALRATRFNPMEALRRE